LREEEMSVEIICCRSEHKYPYNDNYFDAIISIQVIHHNYMANILKSVEEIKRVLRKGGFIYITFPYLKKNIKNNNWDLKRIDENTFVPQKGKEKGLVHHFFSSEEIETIFASFELIKNYIDKTDHRAILGIKK
jgi:ubiquinone/menaquinone biosynthesis C-methylase UbiE